MTKKRVYTEEQKQRKREYSKQWKLNNKEYISDQKEYQKEYHKTYTRKDTRTEYQKNYESDRYKTDPMFKLIKTIRARTRIAIKQYTLSKPTPTNKMLGCDSKTLLEWLQWSGERYDTNFDIHNYSGELYHIDHIKTFEDVSKGVYTLEEVCHYTNLQILPADINLSKGGTSWDI